MIKSSARNSARNSVRKRKFLHQVMLYIAVATCLIVALFPFLWMLSISLKAPAEQFRIPPTLIPARPTLENFASAFKHSMFITYFLNSLFITLLTTCLVVSIAIFSSYGFARLEFPWRRHLLALILFSQLFPLAAIIVPIYRVMSRAGLIDTYTGLIVAYLSFTVPVGVWMLRGFIGGIPEELEESAMVDGCTKFQAFARIILPLSRPGISATAAYIFFVTWQEFMFALTLMTSESRRTLPVGIMDFVGQYETNWGNLMAASVMICIPVFFIFLFLQKQLIRGLTEGAVKA